MLKLIYLNLFLQLLSASPIARRSEQAADLDISNVSELLCELGIEGCGQNRERNEDLAEEILEILNQRTIDIEQTETENTDLVLDIITEEETEIIRRPENSESEGEVVEVVEVVEEVEETDNSGESDEGGEKKDYPKPKYGKEN